MIEKHQRRCYVRKNSILEANRNHGKQWSIWLGVVGSTWYELYEGISPRQTSFLLEKGELVFERPSEDTMRIDLKAKTVNGTCVYEDLFEDTTFDVIYGKRAEFLEETTGALTSVVSSDPSSYIWIFTCRESFKSGNSWTRCPTEQYVANLYTKEWHKKFLDGFTSLKYGFRPGQPQITDGIAAVAGLIIIDARPVLKTIAHSNGTSSGIPPSNVNFEQIGRDLRETTCLTMAGIPDTIQFFFEQGVNDCPDQVL